jgi:hypothetical protein
MRLVCFDNFLELGVVVYKLASRQQADNMCNKHSIISPPQFAGMDRCDEGVIIACGLYLLVEEEKRKKRKLGA